MNTLRATIARLEKELSVVDESLCPHRPAVFVNEGSPEHLAPLEPCALCGRLPLLFVFGAVTQGVSIDQALGN